MRIGLLGAVEVQADGADVALRGVRLRGLLARLALDAGRPVGTSVLVDDLWGEAPPDEAGNALQALVSRLRRTIGADRVATDARGYRLCVDRDAVDALRFDALATTADRIEGFADALALWRGPALADVLELPFAGPVAARLTERRAVAVEDKARLALRSGRGAGELAALTAQLDAAPLRESTAALLARGLHAAGRQADALATADRTIALLADELGVDPGPELAATRLAVLRGDAPAVVAATAPVRLNSFVGRADDVERVRELLGGARLVTLIGPGGAGKTRLAREVVASTVVPVAELAALTGGEQLPDALLAAVGEPELVLRTQDDPPPDTTTRLRAALAVRDTLLVLDNCEHLVDAVALLVESLLGACPRLRVLATSREPLGVPGEVLHPVDALAESDAVRLFADRAAAVRPGFTVTPDVGAICRRLDGQPLPIELAAARLRTLTPAEILVRLDDRFRLLTSGARTAVARHQTLRAVVDWSWELLTETERAVARRLGVFAGGATAAAAEQVCAGAGVDLDVDDVFEQLASLVDKSLVVAVPQPDGAPTRYRMLETIREYAGERLDEAGERAAASAAHTRCVLELTETAEPHLRAADQLTWLAQLRAEADEIDVVLRRATAAGDADTAHRLVAAMSWSWMIRGRNDDADRWLAAVDGLDGPAPVQARALNSGFLVMLSLGRGDTAASERHVEETLRRIRDCPRPLHPVLALFGPVTALVRDDDDGPVVELSDRAVDPWVRGLAWGVRAHHAENEGRIDEQRELLSVAHELLTAVGDRFPLGMVMHSLGELEDLAADYDAAARHYDEAVVLGIELGNDDDVPEFLSRRAQLEVRRGDIAAARAILERIDPARPEWPVRTGLLAIGRAQLERAAGDLGAARDQLVIADAEAARSGRSDWPGDPQRRAGHALTWATVDLTAGAVGAARARVAAAVTAAVESRDGPIIASVAEVAAQVALAEDDPRGACRLLGVATAQRGTLDHGSPDVRAVLAAVRSALGPAADELQRAARELPRADGVALLVAHSAEPSADVARRASGAPSTP